MVEKDAVVDEEETKSNSGDNTTHVAKPSNGIASIVQHPVALKARQKEEIRKSSAAVTLT